MNIKPVPPKLMLINRRCKNVFLQNQYITRSKKLLTSDFGMLIAGA